MLCPNCQIPFIAEQGDKFHCETCGWFQNVGDPNPEWHNIEAPEPIPAPEPDPAKLEPDPAKLEPNPAELEPDTHSEPQVTEYLGGLLTVTEIEENEGIG